jgi:hypothetical protein
VHYTAQFYICVLIVNDLRVLIIVRAKTDYIRRLRITKSVTMDNWCILLGLAMILHSRLIQTEFINNVTQKLISSFLFEYRISFAEFIGCGAAGND